MISVEDREETGSLCRGEETNGFEAEEQNRRTQEEEGRLVSVQGPSNRDVSSPPPTCVLGHDLDATHNSSWADGVPKQLNQGCPNTAGSEDDGLVSGSGDDSSHCPENLEYQMEIAQSEDVANLISKSMTEIKDLLKFTETNSEMIEPTFTKKGRRIGTRSNRRRTRAALLLQAEEKN